MRFDMICEANGIEHRIANDYETAVKSDEIDAVYIALPHHLHARWAIKCCDAKKHVLCEKPIAVNLFEAQQMVEAARRNGVFLGEAAMYRLHPQTLKMLDLLRDGIVGQIRMISTSIGTCPDLDSGHWLLDPARAGGAILDIGIYPISVVRLIAGVASNVPFAEPLTVRGAGKLSDAGVDERASAVLEFENGIIAEVGCSISSHRPVSLHIFGSCGRLEIPDFWSGSGKYGGTGFLNIIPLTGEAYTEETYEKRWLFEVELDAVSATVSQNRSEFEYPRMTWKDSLGNMKTLDIWRREAGVQYPFESDLMIR